MATLYQLYDLGSTVVTEVSPRNGSDFKLQEMYDLLKVDLIEVVDLRDGTILVIDEEGKLKEHGVNLEATRLFRAAFPGTQDYIASSALHCRDDEVQ